MLTVVKNDNPTTNKEMKKVLDLINKGNITYVDNHDNRTKVLEGYVILAGSHVCPIFVNNYFSLSPLYFSKHDNKLHLARPSVGGTMITANTTVEKAISRYNDNRLLGNSGKITEYKIFGGNK